MTPAGLREVATYADGIGPPKETTSLTLVKDAHAAGLLVHPTPSATRTRSCLRAAPRHRPRRLRGRLREYRWYFALGVDGVFSDNPDTAVEARAARL